MNLKQNFVAVALLSLGLNFVHADTTNNTTTLNETAINDTSQKVILFGFLSCLSAIIGTRGFLTALNPEQNIRPGDRSASATGAAIHLPIAFVFYKMAMLEAKYLEELKKTQK